MPATIQGSNRAVNSESVSKAMSENYGYEYEEGLYLHPRNAKHKKLVRHILDRARVARSANSKRWNDWDETDKTLTAHVDLSRSEKKLKNKRPDVPVRIVVPYSYAAMETILTYLTMAYLSQPPLFQYESVSSEDIVANKLMEVMVERQVNHYKAALAIYTWLRDGLAYGIGAVAPLWRSDLQTVSGYETIPVEGLDGSVTEQKTPFREQRITFEGTQLNAIGPRYLLIDPNVAAHDIQDGEFFGWVEETNVYNLLSLEQTQPDTWFNAKYIRKAGPTESEYTVTKDMYDESQLKPCTLVHMYVNLIPSEWDLPTEGDEDYPQKWLFTLADDWCIVRAEPLEASHGKYPAVINAPDFDGYSTYPLARLEIVDGLQETLDWLFNSHISNVRKVINNQLVVDPSLVNVADLKKGKEGGIIRLKSSAWGKSIKDAVYQLQVTDVTRGHISDASSIIDMMQRVSAATDGMMGMQRKGGERVSATESRTTATSAMNRLEKLARLVSIQGMYDLGVFYATNTQDYMSQEIQMRVLGRHPEELVQEYGVGTDLIVEPGALAVPFDTIVRDGSLPIDTTGVAESWIQLFSYMANSQVLSTQYDIGRVFLHIARLLGAKNVNDFKLQGNAAPMEYIERETEKGNMIPATEIDNV